MTSSQGQEGVTYPTSPKCKLLGSANEAEVTICDQTCPALIDTGSMITSVSTNFYQEHLCEEYPLQPLNSLKVECAGGDHLPYLGYIDATLRIPNCMMDDIGVPVLVIKDTSYNARVPVVVGTNVIRILKESGISPSTDSWAMAIDSLQVSSNEAVTSELPVYSCRQIVVEPGTSIVVSARVNPSK